LKPQLPLPVEPLSLSGRRRASILAVAVFSDLIGVPAEAILPLMIAIDVVTAAILFHLAGRPRWLLPILAVECIPALGMFPLWTLAASALILKTKSPAAAPQKGETESADGKK
jgi:hypothetical protein